jgi:hypothetical protein
LGLDGNDRAARSATPRSDFRKRALIGPEAEEPALGGEVLFNVVIPSSQEPCSSQLPPGIRTGINEEATVVSFNNESVNPDGAPNLVCETQPLPRLAAVDASQAIELRTDERRPGERSRIRGIGRARGAVADPVQLTGAVIIRDPRLTRARTLGDQSRGAEETVARASATQESERLPKQWKSCRRTGSRRCEAGFQLPPAPFC